MNSLFLKRLLLLVLSTYSGFCVAQGIDIKKAQEGDQLLLKGINYFKKNELDSALIYIKKASETYKDAASWTKYVSALNDLTFLYNYEKKIAEHFKYAFKAYNESKEYKEYLEKEDIQVSIRAFEQLSTYYYSIGDFNKSIKISEEALVLNINNDISKLEIAKTYFNLGNYYKFAGDSEQALRYFRRALKIRLDSLPGKPSLALTYQDIGRVFELNGQIDSTIYYFEKAKNLLKPIQPKKSLFNKKINNFLLLAKLWSEKGDNQIAQSYINRVLKMPLNDYYQVQLQETIGKVLVSQGNYSEAINAFLKGQEIAESKEQGNTPPLRARRLIALANAYYLSEDLDSAILTYQKALTGLAPGFESNDYFSNPEVNQLLDHADALIILNKKAALLYEFYKNKKGSKHLNAAYDTYLTATKLIQGIRKGIINVESKNLLSGKTIPVYEGAIKTALDLYDLTKDEDYKNAALEFAESNKALLLLESINEQQAKGFAGIPDSLLDKEKELNLRLAFLQQEQLKSQNNSIYDDDIFEIKQNLDFLTRKFETEFPRYYELKYQNDPVSLETIQGELVSANSAIFEYFVGEEIIYLFTITQKTLQVYSIPKKEDIADNINQLRRELKTAPLKSARLSFQNFTGAAHALYTDILQPGLAQLPATVEQLVIIPDDYLNFIPFSILLTEPANPANPGYLINDLEYLLEQYVISYQYSSTLSHKRKQKKAANFLGDFIGFAPSFEKEYLAENRACNPNQLYSLKCNENEVRQINELFNGKIYPGEQALKSNFEKEAANYRILHLATHACIDENNSALNRIFLKDDYLSSFDLYNMQLNTELVVLSACNTGSGELIRGEGVMNLARGFINAGSSSALMSMWSVDDCATSDIMIAFYKNLYEGYSKDEALNNARIEYLEKTTKTKAHPYYWAAFVAFGDMETIKISDSSDWLLYSGLLLLVIVIFIFIKRTF